MSLFRNKYFKEPLHELFKQNYGGRQTCVWQLLEKLGSKSEASTQYDPKLKIRLACDAFPFGVSHILTSAEERPVALISRILARQKAVMLEVNTFH